MADSPFAPEDLGAGMIEGGGEMQPSPQQGPDLGKQRMQAALMALASLAPFTPVGKIMGLASKPAAKVATGAGLGLGVGALAEGAKAQQQPEKFASQIHELQVRLNRYGIKVPTDGRMDPGGPTDKAVQKFKEVVGDGDPLHTLRMLQDPQYKETHESRESEARKEHLETKKTELGLAETKRKGDLDKAIAKAAKEGESWGGFAARWAPYAIGGVLGGTLGALGSRGANKALASQATKADEFAKTSFMTKEAGKAVTPKNVADRAAGVNTFWENGKGQSPFTQVTTSGELSPRSMQYQVSDQTPVGKIYQRSPMDKTKQFGKDAFMVGVAGADYVGAGNLQERNREQAKEARERFRVSQGPQDAVEATHAQKRSDAWGAAQNMALPFASMYLMARKGMPIKGGQPGMPAQKAADAERLKVQDYLNRQPAGGPQSVIPQKGGAAAPIHGGALQPAQKLLPAPTSIGDFSAIARAAKAERAANTQKITTGALAQRTQEIITEHVSNFAKEVKFGPNKGAPLLSTAQINKLRKTLEDEHGMPISADQLRKLLKKAGVILA